MTDSKINDYDVQYKILTSVEIWNSALFHWIWNLFMTSTPAYQVAVIMFGILEVSEEALCWADTNIVIIQI